MPQGLSQDTITNLARIRYAAPLGCPNPMENKVAVITGAAGGIGREIVKVIHSLGGTVVALDRDTTGLVLLGESLPNGDRYVPIPTFHENMTSVANSAKDILGRFDNIDLLINNAGIAYAEDAIPGQSVHGNDLAFTVNYLSHFLLTEILLPKLEEGRIIQLTSTYHWKVDGSEITPSMDGSGPLAYSGQKQRQSSKHVERSYGNTKLAQIWHARAVQRIHNCSAVCACPTWVATGIGGDAARDVLEMLAFPVSGAGITSTINAMFRTNDELEDVLNGNSLVANSRILEMIPFKRFFFSEWATDFGWRDGFTDFMGKILLFGQRFTHEDFIIQRGSPESFCKNDEIDALYKWSKREVSTWL